MLPLVSHLLLTLAAVMVAGRVMGWLARMVAQPPVIGEILAGILLGPSLLGAVAPSVYAFILPPDVLPLLGVVANVSVVLYMFLVGLELNADDLGGRMKSSVVIAQAGIVAPFALALVLAVYLYPLLAPSAVSFLHFSLFFGVAMSITAFPVLARILSDLGMIRTELGTRALACAAVADVTVWCVLALVIGLIQASPGRALGAALVTAVFVGAALAVGRPLLGRFVRRADKRGQRAWATLVMLTVLAGSAWATDAIGVHAIIGAFLAGVVIPHDSGVARALTSRVDPLAAILLPAFFALMGMRTEIGLVVGVEGWMLCALIIVAATVGKVGGTMAAARAVGLDIRYAARLGVLMNTRGLMELIVLNIGLELGVISQTLFTMMVAMALATTLATTPVLQWMGRTPLSDPR